MDELDKGLAIALDGAKAEQALVTVRAQMDCWGLTVPPVAPLVLDFGLGDFTRWGLIEYWIANEAAAGYCGKYLVVFDGQSCPLHRHRRKHETFFVVKGRARMELDGQRRELDEGAVLAVAPGHVHGFQGVGPALLLELSMPCEVDDNYFENADIPIGGNDRPRSQT